DLMEHRFPLVLGHDAAGVVEEVGAGVEGLSVGDEVLGGVGKPHLGEGTYAELTTMSAGSLVAKPASLDFTQAAAVPLSGATALSEQLRPGGRVASAVDAADEEELARRGIRATNVASWLTSQQLAQLGRWLEDGTLRLPEVRAVGF